MWPAGGEKPPKSFAWMTGAGIFYGYLDFTSEQLLVDTRLIPYPIIYIYISTVATIQLCFVSASFLSNNIVMVVKRVQSG